MTRALILLLTFLTGALGLLQAPVSAQAGADPVRAALDTAFAKAVARVGNPGVQAVALRDGKPIWSANSGKAINDPATPVTGSTLFGLASFGKTILATYALHLVEGGVLALDKPIAGYVGQDVPGSGVVTLRMLLTHTAGYPDMYGAPETEPLFEGGDQYDPNRPYTWAMLAPGVHEPVSPGKRYEYSNTGFIIVAHVLSRVSGGDAALESGLRSFYQNLGDQLTAKRSQAALLRLAHGYFPGSGGGLVDYFTAYGATGIPTDLYGRPFGDGMFAGTALGAARFLDTLFAEQRYLRPDTLKTMTTPTPQALAKGETYGMATSQTVVANRTWQGHSGAYGGFTSMGGTDRTRGVTLMVVANQMADREIADAIWKKLAAAYASATP